MVNKYRKFGLNLKQWGGGGGRGKGGSNLTELAYCSLQLSYLVMTKACARSPISILYNPTLIW